jgi:Cu+-exporting ATPase
MTVDETSALRAERDGETFYFCSDHCRQKFLSTPATAKHEDEPHSKAIYTCPMHPEIEQDHPGPCPKCGMALELKTPAPDVPEDNSELRDMTRRFWVGAALALPVFIVAMAHLVPTWSHAEWVNGNASRWGQFILSTPVVFWAGWPFFVRGWRSLVNRRFNMFALIALGVGAAYAFSVVAMLFPQLFPPESGHGGKPALYFEAAAVITVLVLLGHLCGHRWPPCWSLNRG